LFKIISESSIAAGMRRIEALTAEEALKYVQDTDEIIAGIQQAVGSPRTEIPSQIDKLKDSLKEKEKEAKSLRQKLANLKYGKIEKKELKIKTEDKVSVSDKQTIKPVKGIPVLAQKVEGLNNTELRELADSLKQKLGSGIVILGMVSEQKAFLVMAITKDLIDRIQANEFIKEIAPMLGGGGGGRPDFAQAGGTKPKQLDRIIKKSYTILERLIK
jgi:alanyl-tRNA synthetase